jgi:hypothetical protein
LESKLGKSVVITKNTSSSQAGGYKSPIFFKITKNFDKLFLSVGISAMFATALLRIPLTFWTISTEGNVNTSCFIEFQLKSSYYALFALILQIKGTWECP